MVTVRNVLLVIWAEHFGKLQHGKAGSTRMTTTENISMEPDAMKTDEERW
jgi:hypothetical protein